MSLEEDVVIQRMNQGSDAKDMTAFVKALESVGLKIDRKKVDVAIKRYELNIAYQIQEEREIKERIKEKFNSLSKSYIERLLADPSIVMIRFRQDKSQKRDCKCGGTMIIYDAIIEKIEKSGFKLIKKSGIVDNLWGYCYECGEHTDSPKVVNSYCGGWY